MAVQRLGAASCSELGNATWLSSLIRSVGLAFDVRGCRLYGRNCDAMLPSSPQNKLHQGLYQDPDQLADALVYLRTLGAESYLELGVHTAWTATFVAAFLARHAGPRWRGGYAVDVRLDRVTSTVHALLAQLRVSVRERDGPALASLVEERRGAPLGLCLIDGDHSYRGVLRDYQALGGSCRACLFHDVVDFDLFATAPDRGVPAFWAHMTRNVQPARVAEFTRQPALYPPSLGFGLILPGDAGDATPDEPLVQPWYVGGALLTGPGPNGTMDTRGVFWDASNATAGCIGCTIGRQVGRRWVLQDPGPTARP